MGKDKKERHKKAPILPYWPELLELTSLDDAVFNNHKGINIFQTLPDKHKHSLLKITSNLNTDSFHNIVIKTVILIFKHLSRYEVSFKNFLNIIKFVKMYIEEQLTNKLEVMNKSNLDLNSERETYRARRLKAEAAVLSPKSKSRFAVSPSTIFYMYKNIRRKIENTISYEECHPNFRNVFSAIYHYYYNRYCNDCAVKNLSVQKYFRRLEFYMERIKTYTEYYELYDDTCSDQLIFDKYCKLFKRRIRLVLERKGQSIEISSCYYLNADAGKDVEGDEWINGTSYYFSGGCACTAEEKSPSPKDRSRSTSPEDTEDRPERKKKKSPKSETTTEKPQNANSKSKQSSGSGSQPPDENQNNKKESKNNNSGIWSVFLDIFEVNSLDEIVLGRPGIHIFRGLQQGQIDFLLRIIKDLRRNGYLKRVIKIVISIFKTLEPEEVTFQNFLSIIQFVKQYIHEQITYQLVYGSQADDYSEGRNEATTAVLGHRYDTRYSVFRLSILATFNALRRKIKKFKCKPYFRNLISAIYHYYKHRHVYPTRGPVSKLSISQYFAGVNFLLERIKTYKEYSELKRNKIKQLVFEKYCVLFHRRIKIVLKIQDGKIELSSCYYVSMEYEDDEEDDEWVNNVRYRDEGNVWRWFGDSDYESMWEYSDEEDEDSDEDNES